MIDIRFSAPEHQWLGVTVTTDEWESRLDASATPSDSLSELALVLCRLAQGSSSEVVEWHLEPHVVTWQFDVDGESVVLRLLVSEEIELTAPVPKCQLLSRMYRALRRLQAEPAWQNPASAWSHGFPRQAVDRLGDLLDD